MWVVMRVQKFDLEQAPAQLLQLHYPIVVDTQGMIGYLPVYETREDAEKDFPDGPLAEVV